MSASVSPVCGRACARLSIFTASTGPSADTGSPVNGENNWDEPAGGVLRPGNTATSATASPAAATATDTPITIFWRGHLMTPPPTGRSGTGRKKVPSRPPDCLPSASRSGPDVTHQQEHGQAAEVPGEAEPVARPQHGRPTRRDGPVGILLVAAADDPDPGLIAQARGGMVAGDRVYLA